MAWTSYWQISGRQLNPETILFGKGCQASAGPNAGWNHAACNNPVMTAVSWFYFFWRLKGKATLLRSTSNGTNLALSVSCCLLCFVLVCRWTWIIGWSFLQTEMQPMPGALFRWWRKLPEIWVSGYRGQIFMNWLTIGLKPICGLLGTPSTLRWVIAMLWVSLARSCFRWGLLSCGQC